MMIHEIMDAEMKKAVCNQILRALPEWFGIEEAIKEYVNDAAGMIFYAAYEADKPVGFAAVKKHNAYTAELYVLGVLKEYHRQGIGRALIKAAEAYCMDHHMKALSVKTLADTVENRVYADTRQFYLSMGFIPLEVFPDLWDVANPCLMMVKFISAES